MPYTSLLTLIDESPASARRLDYAIRLAAGHGAHLCGIVAIEDVTPPPGVRGVSRAMTDDYVSERREQLAQRSDELGTAFVARALAAGVASAESRPVRGTPFETLLSTGRYFDLTVLSRPHEDPQPGELTLDAITDLTIELGRPVLLVPQSWRGEPVANNVLLAWSGTRESVRALADAMPLLTRADRVDVCLVNVDRQVTNHGEDVLALLGRHGVETVLHHEVTEIDIGNALMSRAADLGADLIVMGAFGHSPLRQSLFGGVSRSMVGSSPLPILMSH